MPPQSERMSSSIRFIDLVVSTFERLKRERNLNLSSLWHYKQNEPWLQGVELDEVRQAFRELSDFKPIALANQLDSEYYEITQRGSDTSKDDLMHDLLRPHYEEAKRTAKSYLVNVRLIRYVGILVVVISALSFVLLEARTPVFSLNRPLIESPPHSAAAFGVLCGLLFMMVVEIRAPKYKVSNEQSLVIALWDAYSAYRDFRAKKLETSLTKAQKLVKFAVRRLEEVAREPSTLWTTLHLERKKLWKIGQELKTRVIPVMGMEKESNAIAEILVHMVRHFAEGSSDSMRSALQSLERFPATPVRAPTRWEEFANAVRNRRIVRFVFIVGISTVLVICPYLYIASISGATPLPAPIVWVTILAGISALGTLLDRVLLG